MKLVKSLLLISAAGFAAISGASAADLGGIKKPAPAEYVRVCNAYGAGFFYIPGTQTCLKIGGRVRAEYQYNELKNRNNTDEGGSGYRTQGRLLLDARTQSEYGPVRAFTRIDFIKRTGSHRSGSQIRQGTAFENAGNASPDTAGKDEEQLNIDAAFVQFAGFTAGRLQSFYDFDGNSLSWIGIDGSTLGPTNLFAYTATFGSGFSATLSFEDQIERRNRVFTAAPTAFNGGVAGSAFTANYGGEQLPDVVGALRVDQGWGSAQLSGALHQIYYTNQFLNSTTNNGAASFSTGSLGMSHTPDSDYGFAVQGGVKINTPFVSPGDYFMAQAQYTQGALAYIIGGGCGQGSTAQCGIGDYIINAPTVDSWAIARTDGTISTKLTTAYGGELGYMHYWTPTIRSSVNGSYIKIDYSGSTGLSDQSVARIAFNTTWSPIAGLDIGAEIYYLNIQAQRKYVLGSSAAALALLQGATTGVQGPKKSDDMWQFRVRVQRDF